MNMGTRMTDERFREMIARETGSGIVTRTKLHNGWEQLTYKDHAECWVPFPVGSCPTGWELREECPRPMSHQKKLGHTRTCDEMRRISDSVLKDCNGSCRVAIRKDNSYLYFYTYPNHAEIWLRPPAPHNVQWYCVFNGRYPDGWTETRILVPTEKTSYVMGVEAELRDSMREEDEKAKAKQSSWNAYVPDNKPFTFPGYTMQAASPPVGQVVESCCVCGDTEKELTTHLAQAGFELEGIWPWMRWHRADDHLEGMYGRVLLMLYRRETDWYATLCSSHNEVTRHAVPTIPAAVEWWTSHLQSLLFAAQRDVELYTHVLHGPAVNVPELFPSQGDKPKKTLTKGGEMAEYWEDEKCPGDGWVECVDCACYEGPQPEPDPARDHLWGKL
jgi:hypothetical protein